MSREIRRVPPDWEHPTEMQIASHYQRGRGFSRDSEPKPYHKPLFDRPYREALADWAAGGADPDYQPNPAPYRPDWSAESMTAYQVYETVTEGTPISPVCKTREELIEWLTTATVDIQGNDRTPMSWPGAEEFVSSGWAPTGISTPAYGYETGLEHIDRTAQEEA